MKTNLSNIISGKIIPGLWVQQFLKIKLRACSPKKLRSYHYDYYTLIIWH